MDKKLTAPMSSRDRKYLEKEKKRMLDRLSHNYPKDQEEHERWQKSLSRIEEILKENMQETLDNNRIRIKKNG